MPPINLTGMGVPSVAVPGATPPFVGGGNGGGGVDVAALLKSITGGNPAIPLDKMIQSSIAVPGAEIPMPQHQYADIKTSQGEFATRSGNRRNAFNNMMGNIKSIVETARKNKEAQDQRNLQVDLERLLTAASNPQDPQNAQVMNDILSDPKKRKAIEKALNISFLGAEDKRDNVSKGALDAALKKVQGQAAGASQGQANAGGNQGASAGGQGQGNPLSVLQQFMSKMPRTATLTPQAQALEQLTKSKVLPDADSVMKAQADLAKQLLNNKGKEDVANILAASKSRTDFQRYLSTIEQVSGRVQAAQLAAAARIKASENIANALIKRQGMIEKRFSSGSYKNDPRFTNLKKEADAISKALEDTQKELKDAPKSIFMGVGTPKKTKDLVQRIQDLKQQQDNVLKKMQSLDTTLKTESSGETNVNINTRTGGDSGTGDESFSPDQELNDLEQEFNAVEGSDSN